MLMWYLVFVFFFLSKINDLIKVYPMCRCLVWSAIMFNVNKHCVQTEIQVFWYLFVFIISGLLKLARSLSSIFQDLASSVPTSVCIHMCIAYGVQPARVSEQLKFK